MREKQLVWFDFNSGFVIFSLKALIDNIAGDVQARISSEVDSKLAEMLGSKGCEWWHKVRLEAGY